MAGCFSPSYENGEIACTTMEHACPDGYHCAGDATCWRNGFDPSPSSTRCHDGAKDYGESDVDCGGACGPCVVNKSCGAGGDCVTGVCDDGVCQLASSPPSWLPAPTRPNASAQGAVVAIPDGRIWQMDGTFDTVGRLQDSAYLAMGTSTWVAVTSEPSADLSAFPAAAVGDDGKIYVVGGYNGMKSTLVRSYDPATDTWSSSYPPIAPGRDLLGAAAIGSAIYVVGGADQADAPARFLDVLMPGATAWTPLAPLARGARSELAVVAGADGLLYALGGVVTDGTIVATVEAYDPNHNVWNDVAPMTSSRALVAGVLGPDGRIYAIGGASANGNRETVEAYTSSLNRWTQKVASLPAARAAGGAAVGGDGRIYYVCGNSGNINTPTTTVYAYGPVITVGQVPPGAPAGGAAGTNQTIGGWNFAAHAHVTVYFDDAVVANAMSDGVGQLPPTAFTVPSAAKGAHRVRVIDDRAQYPALARFAIQ